MHKNKQHCLLDTPEETSINHSDIFNVNTFLSDMTVLSEQSMMNQLILRIKIIQNHISIAWMTSRKYNNFKIFILMSLKAKQRKVEYLPQPQFTIL